MLIIKESASAWSILNQYNALSYHCLVKLRSPLCIEFYIRLHMDAHMVSIWICCIQSILCLQTHWVNFLVLLIYTTNILCYIVHKITSLTTISVLNWVHNPISFFFTKLRAVFFFVFFFNLRTHSLTPDQRTPLYYFHIL